MLTLDKLLENVQYKKVTGNKTVPVTGITSDSRKVRKNFIFVVISGNKYNGSDYVKDALVRGASVIVSENHINHVEDCTLLEVQDTRHALARLTCNFYDNPSRKLRLIGVTGTNGKTTVTHLLESMLMNQGERVGLMGTIEYRFSDYFYRANMTTPDATFLNYLLAKMVEEKVDTALMEVSSHALKQNRVDGLAFDIAVFTNLSNEHLDYHTTIQDYLDTKTSLFTRLNGDYGKQTGAVINTDDPCGRYIAEKTKCALLSCGIEYPADITASEIVHDLKGSSFTVAFRGKKYRFYTPLIGRFNVYNALAAIGVGSLLNIGFDSIGQSFAEFKGVPGRLQKVESDQPFSVYVDYAHTEDGLRQVLLTLRPVHQGRIILVFGCGGDRDSLKRPLMGETACKYADVSVITSDNPRSEDPMKIIREIEKGFWEKKYHIIPERHEAIRFGISQCKPGDVLLIAGKGHEKYQIVGDSLFPFDDVEVAREYLFGPALCGSSRG